MIKKTLCAFDLFSGFYFLEIRYPRGAGASFHFLCSSHSSMGHTAWSKNCIIDVDWQEYLDVGLWGNIIEHT